MTGLVFVDTNVFLYRHDLAVPEKQAAATDWLSHLWRTRTGRVSTQVLQEFYVNATRKLRPGLPLEQARAEIEDLLSWRPLQIESETIRAAWKIQDRFGLSFWDSLIAVTARAGGCSFLLTEDLQHGQDLEGVQVVNPFLEQPGSLS
jgi:predicted nucleic acid-binding protein